jgi:hypothetical protein
VLWNIFAFPVKEWKSFGVFRLDFGRKLISIRDMGFVGKFVEGQGAGLLQVQMSD